MIETLFTAYLNVCCTTALQSESGALIRHAHHPTQLLEVHERAGDASSNARNGSQTKTNYTKFLTEPLAGRLLEVGVRRRTVGGV